MNWNYKTWSPRKQLIFYIIFTILAMMTICHKLGAEETVGQHVQEAFYDGLSAAGMTFAAVESTAMGNIPAAIILCGLATREVFLACHEIGVAWDIYFDPSRDNDRDISPNEANMEHGND